MGKDSLENSRRCVGAGKSVSRIFIEHSDRMNELRIIVQEHVAAGVVCYVATWENVHNSLRRDFALIDENSAAVELKLDEHRVPVEARYHIAEKDRSRKEITELARVWDALLKDAKSADRFLEQEYKATVHKVHEPDAYS